MGRTVRFDQVFVTSLDAAPRESDVLSGLASIDAGEITADKIEVANLVITNRVSASVESTEFTGLTNVFRFTATQVGIGTNNPLNPFQVGADSVIINDQLQHLVAVQGNVISTNVLATNMFKTDNDAFIADANASNVIHVSGNTFSSNATIGTQLVVGSEVTPGTGANVAIFENGNVVIRDGFLNIIGDVDITGNLAITEIPAYTSVDNLVVSNAVILMGDGNNGTYDMAVLMHDQDGESNVFFGYTHTDDTMKLSRTTGGPTTANFTMDSANTVNLHVFGELYTQNNVGIANTSPTYSLSVGSNVYIDDTSSSGNVLYANGVAFLEGLRIGDNGLTVGNLITLDADAAIPMVVTSKIESDGIQTTGVDPSGIANTNPSDTLSIGDKVFINTFGSNTLTVIGNTATGRLITESIVVQDFIEVEGESGISLAANVIIHGDIQGGDSVSNTVSIRAGPQASNISAIEVNGAKTSASHQTVILKTKNTERMRVASDGNVGIANTAPTEKLTIGGNLRVNGSNAVIAGTSTNYIRSKADTLINQTKIESRVGTGKGLNFYASTSDSMGPPKLTILETSNVGIGTTTPKGLLHTSGGTVFINDEPVHRVAYDHLNTPLVISNSVETEDTVSQEPVLELVREGVLNNYEAVRATFKLGKHNIASNKSKTQLDIYLADEDYSDETDILTLRSDGRVGIGSTVPEAFLEVVSSGIGNARENSLMIHNHHGAGGAGDAIMAAQTDATQGNAFTSYIQTTNDSNPRGWSVGITGTRDFRITRNINEVSDSTNVGMYIDGSTRNVGISTDAPRAKLEVSGNVIIGNKLSFGGLTSDEFGNTFIQEQYYDAAAGKTELVIFKGNDRTGTAAPDRIRSIAAEHLFQTYNTNLPSLTTNQIQSALDGDAAVVSRAMTITPSGVVVIGALPLDNQGELDVSSGTRFYVGGGLEFADNQAIKFGALDIFTATGVVTQNIVDSIGDAPLLFRQKVQGTSTEYARFTNEGLIGFGTNSPEANVHIYSDATGDTDVLKLQNPGTNSKVGLILHTNDDYGGYVRGFSDSTHSVHGTVIGGVNNGTEGDGIHIIHTSNVGVGTVNPSEHFTVYNGTARLEHATSNAILEFKTTGGVSNIYGDHTGNVFVDPVRSFVVNSDTEIVGDLQIDGKIDLGNQVAVDLGGQDATAALEVGGGFISNSNEVACKRYAINFTRTNQQSQDIQLRFDKGSYYAKIVAILRSDYSVHDMSTLVLEVQGGTHDGTTNPSENITIGTKNLFGGGNLHPWNPTVTTGKFGLLFAPEVTSGRTYYYDLYIELITSRGGKLLSAFSNNPGGTNAADNFSGTELVGPNTSTNATGKNFGY